MGEFIIGIMAGLVVGVGITGFAYSKKIARARSELVSKFDELTADLAGSVLWKQIDYKNMETSHDEILITNEKGWYRVCRCLGGKGFGVDFYDNYDMIIKGFNPTHYVRLFKHK